MEVQPAFPKSLRRLILQATEFEPADLTWQLDETEYCLVFTKQPFQYTSLIPTSISASSQLRKLSASILELQIHSWQAFFHRIPPEFKAIIQDLQHLEEILYLGTSIPLYFQKHLEGRFPDAFICQVAPRGTISRGLILLREDRVSPAHASQLLQEWMALHRAD